jgi:hypothetical protein
LIYAPFDDALDEFLRQGPVGVVPETIRANDIDWQAFRRLSRDEIYEGVQVERAGGPVTSVRGHAPDRTPFEWPPSE